MSLPGVTVVVTTRDRPALLADALRSVVAQDPAPLEVRIADDATPPAEPVPSVPGLEVVVIPTGGGGTAAARNRAAAGARGEVLVFLDDDDLWLPGHLAGLAAAFADPALGFAWRDSAVIRERVEPDGRRVELARLALARDWDAAMMRDNDYLPPSAWGVRRALFERLGGFDETFEFSEDWDFALRAAALTRPRRVPGATVEVRLRESGNLSAGSGPGRIESLRRLAARHGLPEIEPRTFWEVAEHAARAPEPAP